MAFGTRPTVIRGDQEGPQRLGRGSGILSAKRGGQSPRGGALQRGGLRGADDGRNLDEVPKRHRAGAKARLILLALSARLKSCPDKKQDGGWKDAMADGLALWSPPHRAKDARWMGHPKFGPSWVGDAGGVMILRAGASLAKTLLTYHSCAFLHRDQLIGLQSLQRFACAGWPNDFDVRSGGRAKAEVQPPIAD